MNELKDLLKHYEDISNFYFERYNYCIEVGDDNYKAYYAGKIVAYKDAYIKTMKIMEGLK